MWRAQAFGGGGGSQYDPQVGAAAAANAATAAQAQQFSQDFYTQHVLPLLQQSTDAAGQTSSRLNTLYDLNIKSTQDQQARYNSTGIPAEDAYYKSANTVAGQADKSYNEFTAPAQSYYEGALGDLAKAGIAQQDQYGIPAQSNFYQTSAADAAAQQRNFNVNAMPAQDAYYAQARNYSDPAEYERQAQTAMGDVAQAGQNQQDAMGRRFASMGISANSPAAIAAQSDFATNQAAAQAAAGNKARNAARSLGISLTSDAGNMSNGNTGGLATSANAAQFGRADTTGITAAGTAATFNPSFNAAALGVRGEHGVERGAAFGIECVVGLIEQPECGCVARCQACQGDASALPLRERAHRRVATVGHAEAVERRVDARCRQIVAAEAQQEAQRLEGGEVVFQPVGVGEVEQRPAGDDTGAADAAGDRCRKPRERAQQRRLALPVGAAQPGDAACGHAHVESFEQHAFAARAGHAFEP